MALARVNAMSLAGLDALPVDVEVDIRAGLPAFSIVGLGDKAIEESKERIKSAITNSGFLFPTKKVVVNLAPAHIKKEGSWFDVPIAVGILVASGQIEKASLDKTVALGELALDGSLRFSPGMLIAASSSAKHNLTTLILPMANAREASLIEGIRVIPAQNLFELVTILRGETKPTVIDRPEKSEVNHSDGIALEDIKGQLTAKRALIIALSGGHNILFFGPPGTGKSLLAKAAQSLLPPLELEAAIEVSKIYSLVGALPDDQPLMTQAPYRAPHHSASHVAIIGGGSNPLPGEITLAHRGILFLDELPEFNRLALESLRQPLENGHVSIARAKMHLDYPAQFTLIAAMNPCPCGYYGDKKRQCSCTMGQIQQYRKKISGPILDRIDLFVKLPRLTQEELLGSDNSITADNARAQIDQARKFSKTSRTKLNSQLTVKNIEKEARLEEAAQTLLLAAMEKFQLSPRSYHKAIKVSRTIADLSGMEKITPQHVAEALQFRPPLEIQ